MATLLPHQTTTVEDFIDSSNSVSISYEALSLLNILKDEDISMPVFNVVDDYIEELLSYSNTCTLSEAQFLQYYQAPKLLSRYLYNNSELDFIIMRLNGIYDVKDFTMRKIRLISRENMNMILSQIYNANKRFIDEYNERNNKR